MKKKIFSFLLAFALIMPVIFSMTACGKKKDPKPENHIPTSGEVYETNASLCTIDITDEAKLNAYLQGLGYTDEVLAENGITTAKQKALLLCGSTTTEADLFSGKAYYYKLEFGDNNTVKVWTLSGSSITDYDRVWGIYNGDDAEYAKYKGKAIIFDGELNDMSNIFDCFEIVGNTLVFSPDEEEFTTMGILPKIICDKK